MFRVRWVALIAAFCMTLTSGSCTKLDGQSVPSYSVHSSSSSKSIEPLPRSLASALAEIKTKSSMAVLLPSELPQPFAKARNAVVEKASKNEYAVTLYYELGIGDAGFAAFFAANAHPNYGPKDIGKVREVKLSRGLIGYFCPVSCGGSCAPANLWWQEDGILYQVQLELSATLPEGDQQRVITSVVDSAIRAGAR